MEINFKYVPTEDRVASSVFIGYRTLPPETQFAYRLILPMLQETQRTGIGYPLKILHFLKRPSAVVRVES